MADWRPLDLLPGVYALALAGLLLAALRRWYDPVPRRALAAFTLVLLPLLGPVLFGGKVLLPLDSLRRSVPFTLLSAAEVRGNRQVDLNQQIAPTQMAVRRALAEGRWPLWDPLVGAGIPLLADPQSQALQPLVQLALPLPLAQAAGVVAFFRLFVALVFMHLLLRRQGLGEGASLCGALAYGLSGFLLIWLGWPMVNAAALLPAALYAVVLFDARGARADRLLLWLALLALLAGGHPEVVLYAVLLVGAFLLARALRRQGGARLRMLREGALAAALAGGVAALAWAPLLDHLPKSERAAVVDFYYAGRGWPELRAELADPKARAAWRRTAAQRLLPIAAPNAFGNSRYGPYWGEVNSNDNSTGFVGGAALLLALAGLAGARRLPQERLMQGTLAASLLLLAQPPGLGALVHKLPLLGGTAAHTNRRLLLVVAFCLAYLAACAAERLRRGELAGGRIAAAAWAVLLGLLIAWTYATQVHPLDPAILADFRRLWLWAQLAALTAGAAVLLAGRGRTWAPWALAALAAAELLAAHGPVNPPMPRRLAYPSPPPVAFLERRLGADRMAGLGGAFPPNLPSLYGLADVRVYNPLAPMLYRQVLEPLFRTPERLIPDVGRPRHPLYDLLGVRYVLTPPGARHKRPLRRVVTDPAGWVYERPRPLPRLFLPAAARSAHGPPAAAWGGWLERNRDFAARSLVERIPGGLSAWSAAHPAASRLAVERLGPSRVAARLALAEPRLLASSVYQDRHWRPLADGRRIPAAAANGPFAGAWLPAGARELALVYLPAPFVAGCALAALALAGVLAWVVPPPGAKAFAPSSREPQTAAAAATTAAGSRWSASRGKVDST